MRKLITLFCSIGILILPSCYCSKAIPKTAGSHPKFLQSLNSTYVYELCCGSSGRTGNELSAYYGFPSYQLKDLAEHYTASGLMNIQKSTNGQFGLRLSHSVAPPFTRLRIIRLGIDYSYTKNTLRFDETATTQSNLHFISNRLMFNSSIYTFVTLKGFAGYLQLQGGANFFQKNYEGTSNAFTFTDKFEPTYFDYQIGYGIQYFLFNRLSVFAEAGYGSGVYTKTGIALRF